MNMNTHSKEAEELLRIIADTMIHPPSNEYVHGGEPWIVLGPEHADVLKRGGLSKADVKRRLWELSKMRVDRLSVKDLLRARESRTSELGELKPDTLLPISVTPDAVQLLVAGGPGTHSIFIPSFGNTHAATREIEA